MSYSAGTVHHQVPDSQHISNEVSKHKTSSPGDGRGGPSPEGGHPLLPGDPGQGVEHAGVVPPLVHRQRPVGRHPDEGDLGRRPHERPASTGGHTQRRLHEEARRLALSGEGLEEPGVDAESGGGVGRLPQQTSGEAGVEGGHALVLDHPGDDGEGGGLGTAGSLGDLHPVLDQVERLDEAGGEHASAAAEEELDAVGDSLGLTHGEGDARPNERESVNISDESQENISDESQDTITTSSVFHFHQGST